MSALTKQDVLNEIDPNTGLEELAALIGMEVSELISVAELSGQTAIDEQATPQDAGFYAFLTGLEVGFRLGVKAGERV